jgi:hypothetical protein
MAKKTVGKKEKIKRGVGEQRPPKEENIKSDEEKSDYGGINFDNFNKNLGCGG